MNIYKKICVNIYKKPTFGVRYLFSVDFINDSL